VFTPLGVVAFSTLPAEMRTDGTALFSLLRNVGLAIGVSVTSVVLTQSTQIMHAQDRRQRHVIQPLPPERGRLSVVEHGQSARTRRAQCRGHPAGCDHRLCQRLQAAVHRQLIDVAATADDELVKKAMLAPLISAQLGPVIEHDITETAEAVATDIHRGTPLGRKIDIVDGDYAALVFSVTCKFLSTAHVVPFRAHFTLRRASHSDLVRSPQSAETCPCSFFASFW
jgi:hypothetical protein